MTKRKIILIAVACIVLLGAFSYLAFANRTSDETLADIPGQTISEDTTGTAATTSSPAPIVEPDSTPPATTSGLAPQTPAQTPAPSPSGTFTGVEGRNTSGTFTIVTTTEGRFIRLNDDFKSSGAAPDNRVYLGNADGYQVEISKLKAPNGGQNFKIPDNIDIDDYSYVWIHCKAFNTTYGKAVINR